MLATLALGCLLLPGPALAASAPAQSNVARLQSHLPNRGPAVVVIGVVQGVDPRNTARPIRLNHDRPYALITLHVERRLFGSAADTVAFGTSNVVYQDDAGEWNEIESGISGPHFRSGDRALAVLYDGRLESSFPENAVTNWWCRHAIRLDAPLDASDQWVSLEWPQPDKPDAPQPATEYPFSLTPPHRDPPTDAHTLPLRDAIDGILQGLRANGMQPGTIAGVRSTSRGGTESSP